MNKAKFIICAVLMLGFCVKSSQAAGLDEIYRDLVRSDNRGYLPLFVKNRQAPSLIDGDKEFLPDTSMEEETNIIEKGMKDINFKNERLIKNAEIEAAELRWKKVLANVQAGYVSSFELDELNQRVENNNPQAVEVLAWIYSKGVGVEPDLIKAFGLYKQAINLKVPDAMENAVKVYKAMSPAQKEELAK